MGMPGENTLAKWAEIIGMPSPCRACHEPMNGDIFKVNIGSSEEPSWMRFCGRECGINYIHYLREQAHELYVR